MDLNRGMWLMEHPFNMLGSVTCFFRLLAPTLASQEWLSEVLGHRCIQKRERIDGVSLVTSRDSGPGRRWELEIPSIWGQFEYIGWMSAFQKIQGYKSMKKRKEPSILSIFSEDVLKESLLGALLKSPDLLECSYFHVCIIQYGIIRVKDLSPSHFLYYTRLLLSLHCIFFKVGKKQDVYEFLIFLSRSYKKKVLCEVCRGASSRMGSGSYSQNTKC